MRKTLIAVILTICTLVGANAQTRLVGRLVSVEQQAIEGAVNQMWTITALQMHPHGIIVCDEAACDELKVGTYKYFKDIEKNNL